MTSEAILAEQAAHFCAGYLAGLLLLGFMAMVYAAWSAGKRGE